MAKVYSIVAYRNAADPKAQAAYSEKAGPAIQAAGGRIIARGKPLQVFEAGRDERTLIIEWDNAEDAAHVYETDAYKEALALLGDNVERDIRIIESVE